MSNRTETIQSCFGSAVGTALGGLPNADRAALPVAVRLLDYALAMAGASATGEGGGAVKQLAGLRLAAEAAALRVLTAYLESYSLPEFPGSFSGDCEMNPPLSPNELNHRPVPVKGTGASSHPAGQEES